MSKCTRPQFEIAMCASWLELREKFKTSTTIFLWQELLKEKSKITILILYLVLVVDTKVFFKELVLLAKEKGFNIICPVFLPGNLYTINLFQTRLLKALPLIH